MGSTQQTSNVYSIFCRSEKKVYFRPFLWCFYVYFSVLRVNIDGFESFSSIWGMFKVKKHKFQTKLDIENFRSILFWSENVNSGVKLDTSNLFNSQSNQNDLTHLIVLLIQFPKISKSVWSKCPNDCFLELGLKIQWPPTSEPVIEPVPWWFQKTSKVPVKIPVV